MRGSILPSWNGAKPDAQHLLKGDEDISFWSWVLGEPAGTPPVPEDYHPGDPEGVVFEGEDTYSRALPQPVPSAWSGWPGSWAPPNWDTNSSMNKLVDAAWTCIDLNSSVMASMPIYRLRNGAIMEPLTWMSNPDPLIYTSWQEFAKQLYWDYQLAGEAFVLPMARGSDGYPMTFRVIPPWLVNIEMRRGTRTYQVGSEDVTGEILHIRYQSNTVDAHGHGPLETGGARMTSVGLLQRYADNLAQTGGVPLYWLGIERKLSKSEAQDLLDQWVESRTVHAGHPAILSGNASLNQAQSMNAHDMALLELSQFNESRIAILLGVPPFLVGLPGAGGLTYSNVTSLFDFHDRSSLRPKANMVMSALSGWALPHTQILEVNRDDYTRPDFNDRCAGYKTLVEIGVLTKDEVRVMERFYGQTTTSAAVALTGGDS